jgi:UDP-N-acetylmuramoylalanine--D-glutamate ligase
VDAKKNIYLHQNGFGRTVLNLDNELTAACAAETRGNTLLFSRRAKTNGAWCSEDGEIFFGDTFVMREEDILLPGKHNVENYLAAISAVWGDVEPETIVKVAKTFGGVEHRNELVRTLDGVRWYNDSIATSPSRAMIGTLSLYDFKIVMIAGGADKKVPFDELGEMICEKVKTLILLSPKEPIPGMKEPAAAKIEKAVREAKNYTADAPVIVNVHTMEDAVAAARACTKDGDVVSLCPAATGFDMFKSFAERGDIYRTIVQSL